MKLFSPLSRIRGIGYLLVITLCVNCKKDNISTNPTQPLSPESLVIPGGENLATAGLSSQTRTANYFFNTNLTKYAQSGVQYLKEDDNSYQYTPRINSLQRVYLILQDFQFTIPANAVIGNIIVRVRKFKTDKAQLKDCFVHLLTATNTGESWKHYGAEMARVKELWPGVETETSYSQGGKGNNGILNMETRTTAPYEWTPALINNSTFGLYFLTGFPDKGNCYVYFDKVEITVEYSLP